jgi:hypothetical protein
MFRVQVRALRARLDNFLKAAASDFDSAASSGSGSSTSSSSHSGSGSASNVAQHAQTPTGSFLASTVVAPFSASQEF